MQAVSPTGLPIIGTWDRIPAIAPICEGSWRQGRSGNVTFDYESTDADVHWDDQETLKEDDAHGRKRRVFMDSEFIHWREDQLRLVDDATEAEPLMPLAEAEKIKAGDKLRVLVAGIGGVGTPDGGEEELTFAAGETVTVSQIDNFPGPQGHAITIVSANGVVNVFDEADFGGWYPFAILVAERCTYPACKCIVQTSTTQPEPTCPKGLPPAAG